MKDQWLVIGRCGCDDIPMRLFADEGDAIAYTDGMTPLKIQRAASRIMGVDVSMICNVSIARIDPAGRVHAALVYKEFDNG